MLDYSKTFSMNIQIQQSFSNFDIIFFSFKNQQFLDKVFNLNNEEILPLIYFYSRAKNVSILTIHTDSRIKCIFFSGIPENEFFLRK